MTAPEREALVPCQHDRLQFGSGDFYIFCHACGAWWGRIAPSGDRVAPELSNRGFVMDGKDRVIEAIAPAVTVTEEMVEQLRGLSCAASSAEWHENQKAARKHWRAFDELLDQIKVAISSPRKSERDAVLEEAASLVENFEEGICNKRGRTLAPRTPGNLMSLAYASAIRALKSTTPQTGSQE